LLTGVVPLNQRVSTREEGRSPRLPAEYDNKVQWVEVIYPAIGTGPGLQARIYVFTKGFGPDQETWLNLVRNPIGSSLDRQKLDAQNQVELHEAIGDPT